MNTLEILRRYYVLNQVVEVRSGFLCFINRADTVTP